MVERCTHLELAAKTAIAYPGHKPYDCFQTATSGAYFLVFAAKSCTLKVHLGLSPDTSKFYLKILAHLAQGIPNSISLIAVAASIFYNLRLAAKWI